MTKVPDGARGYLGVPEELRGLLDIIIGAYRDLAHGAKTLEVDRQAKLERRGCPDDTSFRR